MAKKPTDAHVIQYILKCKKAADMATKDRRLIWEELWQVFQNKQDFSGKEDWQSQCFVPKLSMTIEKSAALIEKALFNISKLFKMEIPAELRTKAEKDKTGKVLEALEAKRDQDEKEFKFALENSNFTNVLSAGVKTGFLLGLAGIKDLWENGLTYEHTDVRNVYVAANHRPYDKKNPDYLIERKVMRLAELKKTAKEVNKGGRKIYRIKEVNQLSSINAKTDERQKEQRQKGLRHYTPVDPEVEILEFWGDIVLEEDAGILENQLIQVAEETKIIRWQDNPFTDKKGRISLMTPIVYPHRGVSGISLIESSVQIQYTLNNTVNMGIDNMNFSVNKIFAVNTTQLFDPESVNRIFPGKMVKTKGDIRAAFGEVGTSSLKPEVFLATEMFEKFIEKGTAVTEFLEGATPRRKMTKGEVVSKTDEAHTYFDVIARRLENGEVKELLQRGWDMMKQFANKTGDYEFKVGGISLLLSQKEQTEKIQQVLGIAGKIPMFAQWTDLPELWQKYLSILSLGDVYKEPTEQGQGLPGQGDPGQEQPPSGGRAEPQGDLPPEKSPEQEDIEKRAAAEAKKKVNSMSPEDIKAA